MSVSVDNYTNGGSKTFGTSQTVSFTTSGDNRVLLAALGTGESGRVHSATYAGEAMTKVNTYTYIHGSGNKTFSFFLKFNPALGENDLVFSTNFSENYGCWGIVSLQDAVTADYGGFGYTNCPGAVTSISSSITTESTDSIIIELIPSGPNQGMIYEWSPRTGQTKLFPLGYSDTNGYQCGGAYYINSSIQTKTFTWEQDASFKSIRPNPFVIEILSIPPVTGPLPTFRQG